MFSLCFGGRGAPKQFVGGSGDHQAGRSMQGPKKKCCLATPVLLARGLQSYNCDSPGPCGVGNQAQLGHVPTTVLLHGPQSFHFLAEVRFIEEYRQELKGT